METQARALDPSSGRRTAVMPDGAFATIGDLLADRASVTKAAVIAGQVRLQYAELDQLAHAAAVAMLDAGVEPGDRVAVSSHSAYNLLIAFLGTQLAGLVWVGVHAFLTPEERRTVCDDAAVELAIVDDPAAWQRSVTLTRSPILPFGRPDGAAGAWWTQVQDRVGQRSPVEIDPHAVSALAYTSGTTGRPKGVMHSQHSILAYPQAARWACHDHRDGSNWSDGLIKAVNVPLSILNGIVTGPIDTFVARGTYVCVDRPGSMPMAEAIQAHGVEYIFTVPTVIWDLVHKPEIHELDISSLAFAGVGGSMLDDDLCGRMAEVHDVRVMQEYGLTESPSSVAGCRMFWEDLSPGAIGPPYPHVDVRALSQAVEPLPPGEIGEIGIRAVDAGHWDGVYTGMLGYWNQAEETEAATAGGWLHTGDLGYIADNGELVLVGRKKEMILRGGENVFPAEIEPVLRGVPGVIDAAVAGLADQRLGEVIGAFLQVDPQNWPGIEQAQGWAAERLKRTKRPDRWFIVEEIPRNSMMKVQRQQLLDLTGDEVGVGGREP